MADLRSAASGILRRDYKGKNAARLVTASPPAWFRWSPSCAATMLKGPRAANAVAADGRPRLDGVIGWSRIRAVAGGPAEGRPSLSSFPPLEPGPGPRPAMCRPGQHPRWPERVAGARLQGQESRPAGDPPRIPGWSRW